MRTKRGKAAKKVVETTCIKKVNTEHFTWVSEPEVNYLTHVTPDNGDAESISRELVDVI